MSARNYNTSMTLQEKNYYISKFQMKMSGCLPSVAAEWIDGINKGTQDDLRDIYYEVRNDIDWASKDPQREKGDMPVWYTREIYDPKVKAGKELKDDENPAFLFSTTYTSLLAKIASGEIDANYIARVELANRGLDSKGTWVGFKEAKRIHNIL